MPKTVTTMLHDNRVGHSEHNCNTPPLQPCSNGNCRTKTRSIMITETNNNNNGNHSEPEYMSNSNTSTCIIIDNDNNNNVCAATGRNDCYYSDDLKYQSDHPLHITCPRFRVKHLGKRKFEILRRPFILIPTATTSKTSPTTTSTTKTIAKERINTPLSSRKQSGQEEKGRSADKGIHNSDNSNDSISTNDVGFMPVQVVSNDQKVTNKLVRLERLEYVPSDIPNFWHCPKCIHLPLSKRPKHSVIFHASSSGIDLSGSSTSSSNSSSSKAKQDRQNVAEVHSKESNVMDVIDLIDTFYAPPSSDDYQVIAIHSYMCKLKCEEIKLNLSCMGHDEYLSDSFSSSDDSNSDDESNDDGATNDDDEDKLQLRKTRKYRKCRRRSFQEEETATSKTKSQNNKFRAKKAAKSNSFCSNRNSSATGSNKKKRGRPQKTLPKKEHKSAKNVSIQDSVKDESEKDIIKIEIPSTDNELIDLSYDAHITASIDYYLLSQVKRCLYDAKKDKIAYLRQKALPEEYPGVQCIYCDKQWFFNSPIQLATGFPKIEQHLTGACDCCPKIVKDNIYIAKGQEDHERNELRLKSSQRITRRQYAHVVIARLGAPKLN